MISYQVQHSYEQSPLCFQLIHTYYFVFQRERERRTSTGLSTPTTRGSSWRRSSTTAATSPSGGKLNLPTGSGSQRDRYSMGGKEYFSSFLFIHDICRWRYGFKTGEPRSAGVWRSRTMWCWRTSWTRRAWEPSRLRWAPWTTASPPPPWALAWPAFHMAFPSPITSPKACMGPSTLAWWNLSEEKNWKRNNSRVCDTLTRSIKRV